MQADLLLHVVDAADPDRERHIEAVERVLAEIEAHEVPRAARLQQGRSPVRRRAARASTRGARRRGQRVGGRRRRHRRARARGEPPARPRHPARPARVRRAATKAHQARIARVYRHARVLSHEADGRADRDRGGRAAAAGWRGWRAITRRDDRRCDDGRGSALRSCCPGAGARRWRPCVRPKRLPPPAASAAAPAYPTFERPELGRAAGRAAAAGRPRCATTKAGPACRPGGPTRRRRSSPRSSAARRRSIRPGPAHGYARAGARDTAGAVASFDAALAARPGYVPALAGRAEALDRRRPRRRGDRRARGADRRRSAAHRGAAPALETLRLQVIEGLVAEARAARQRGDLDAARTAWTRAVEASPDSADFLRELAAGRAPGRAARRRADPRPRARCCSTTATPARTRWSATSRARAATCGRRSRRSSGRRRATRGPNTAPASRTSSAASIWPAMPEAFRSIGDRGAVSRGDLAALLGVAPRAAAAPGRAASRLR